MSGRLGDELVAGLRTLDARFIGWTLVAGVGSLVAFGVLTAIIPSPIFIRPIPPEPFAIVVWIASAPLMGFILATYLARPAPSNMAMPLGGPGLAGVDGGPDAAEIEAEAGRGSTLGSLAGFGAFLAIGCPVCNKVALLLLGTSGALSVYAPIQPLIGAASMILLVVTAAWRLRLRARAGACRLEPA